MTPNLERRIASGRVTLRQATDATPSVISGLGAVYNRETIIGGWFRESIAPGAFAPAIGPGADIRALFNHDPNWVLGRTVAKSLRLTDTAEGLAYEADVNPNDPDACSVAAKIARGDVSGSSFSFRVKREEWIEPDDGDNALPLRIIHEFAEIEDVGPVTFPAYQDTTSEARARAAEIRSRHAETRDVPKNVSTKKADPSTSWTAPTLADFSKQAWGDLTDVERNHIAGHFAWRSGQTYGDLHLPHHRPSDGSVVLRGVVAAAGRLDQLAGGDKAAIRAHLEAHYHAFDLKAPWEDDSKAAQDAVEQRLHEDDDRERRLRLARASR